ncbi:hypothetical protein Cfor_09022 [Coptotermes formosanus]|jgi:hypothetical protein|uniref:Uncharacterized protein n=1 Tax=Coptotermes formosanus TaxID=36987 RepID=A0A6L2QAJ7_COPFO|nr:hypothetical protein Cfor_09022 [Coptotermes formosanus]
MLQSIYTFKEEKTIPGFKAVKYMLGHLFSAKAVGDHRLKLLHVCYSKITVYLRPSVQMPFQCIATQIQRHEKELLFPKIITSSASHLR